MSPSLAEAIARTVKTALDEDLPWGDVTAEALIPIDARMRADLVAREELIFVGAEIVKNVFQTIDPRVDVRPVNDDGDSAERGAVLVEVEGPARSILMGERVALNLCQHLSAIATLTATYVAAVAHTPARIVDTRKTTAGLRQLEKYAVRCGGGRNHRFSLSDAVMVKDNHIAVMGLGGQSLTESLLSARAFLGHTTHFEVEVDTLDQLEPVLQASPDSVLLDNFSLADLKEAVAMTGGRALLEASGGVNLQTVRAIAETGVDLISVGALTHSAGSVDIGLDTRAL